MKRAATAFGIRALALVAAFGPSSTATQALRQPTPSVLAIIHVTVIDGTDAPPQQNQTVLIRDGRIAELGKSESVRIPKDAEVVEGRGKFLIPGLWDMHAHALAAEVFPLFVANGVTGIRVMWGIPQHQVLRREFESGMRLGPRMIIASGIFDGPEPVWEGSVVVRDAAGGREAVQKAKGEGADFIKIYNLIPREAYFAIMDESRKVGLPVAGHIPWSVTAREASDAGQKSIEHVRGTQMLCPSLEENRNEAQASGQAASAMTRSRAQRDATCLDTYDRAKAKEFFSQLAKNRTWLAPTLTVLRAYAFLDQEEFRADARLKYMRPSQRRAWLPENNRFRRDFTAEDWALQKKMFKQYVQVIGQMRRAGLQILAGTDTANPYCFPGFSLHDELALLVEAGLTPLEALQAATSRAAHFLGRDAELGTVQNGKLADLVLLEENPLENIQNTKKIAGVVSRGKWLSRSGLDEILGRAEAWAASQ